ncbi:MAG: choice-of-anchor D domain-containing protein, partial [bacterium]
GGTTSFTIRFTPSGTGIRQASISIANTDINENPYNFDIQGTGITPEIDVQGNSISITDGDDVPTSIDNTNFGNIAVISGTISHTFTIENLGNADLHLTNHPPVEITGTHQSDFTVTSQPDSLITPGATSSFAIEFDPSGPGIRAAILSITNDDINENPYNFTIQGTGIANEPEIVVMGNGIIISDGDFSPDLYDDTYYGYISVTTGSVSHTFTIINQGGSELILTGTPAVYITGPAQSDFTVTSQPTYPIASQGGSTTFTIQFDPSQSGMRNAEVSIASNDNDENPYNFSLQGEGIVIASQQDSLALVALYNSTHGDEWTYNYNWLETPVQFWYGVTKNEDVVTAVELSVNNLIGTIPPEIENLSYLITLDLQLNQLTDSIPSEIGNLSNLKYLYLNNNQLNGSLPPELGNLSHLEYLYLNNNQFSGSIPSQIGNLTNLVKLDLQNSNLTNSIPAELEYLTDLEYLWLNNNSLSGSIPPEMGNLPNLKYLSLNSNHLIGTIPESISDLTSLTNDKSDFRWNSLHTDDGDVRNFLNEKQRGGDWESTQTIAPDNIFCESVTDTSLILRWSLIPYTNNRGGYKIYYAISTGGPYTEYEMTADKTIDSLLIKELSPEIPYYFVLRTQTDPHPNNNNTVLSEQSQEISCTTLQYRDSLVLVALYDSTDGDNWTNNANWLSQPVETWYGVTVSNKHVTALELNDNNLTGTLPQEMENLDKLKKLTLNGNRLTGSIPTNLINLTNLINDSCDFRWNGLYTDNKKLLTFLNEKQEGNDWKSTQTITPDNVFCGSETSTSIEITWTLISYKEDAGGYRVFYSTTSGGPYTEFGITANKTVNSLVVTGLNPTTKYYFIVR